MSSETATYPGAQPLRYPPAQPLRHRPAEPYPPAEPLRYPPAEPLRYPPAQPLRVPIEHERAVRGGGGVVRLVSCGLLGGVVLLILLVVAAMALGVSRFNVIDTASMRPTLSPGDVAVLTPERIGDLRRGQVVAFHPPGEPRLTVIHRVFSVRRLRGSVVIQTKGDANNTTDAWKARLVGNTVWRASAKVPKLGYLSVWSGQRPVRFVLLIAIVVLLVSTLLGAIWRSPPAGSRPVRRRSRRPARSIAGPDAKGVPRLNADADRPVSRIA
jgi:signal peptidase I